MYFITLRSEREGATDERRGGEVAKGFEGREWEGNF